MAVKNLRYALHRPVDPTSDPSGAVTVTCERCHRSAEGSPAAVRGALWHALVALDEQPCATAILDEHGDVTPA